MDQDMMTPFLLLAVILRIHRVDTTFSMLSRGQLYVTNSGDSIELDCEFYTKHFNLFDNPVLWVKSQYHEATRVNIMGNINDPFVKTGRFKVTFLPSPPRFRLVLGIEGLSLEDSGNYTCEVRGTSNTVMAIITHRLFIRAPVQDIVMSKDNCTENCDSFTPGHLTFTENEPSQLQCVATGGNPPPNMKIFIDDFDITYRFRTDTFTRLLGSYGLRIMHSSVHTRTDKMLLTAADDGKVLRCHSEVLGLPPNVTMSIIRVQYAPVITCEPNVVADRQKNVHVTCYVRSNPTATTLFWVIDVNGTTLSEGQIVDEYWTLVKDIGDAMETKLFMRQATAASFRKYTLVAENSVGIQREDVELMRKQPNVNGGHMGSDPPYYGSRNYDRDSGSPQLDYIFIPANSGRQRHTANTVFIIILTFQTAFLYIGDH